MSITGVAHRELPTTPRNSISCLTSHSLRGMRHETHDNRNGSKPTTPFNWQGCVDGFKNTQIEQLAKWRGYSQTFCESLCSEKLVGLHNECIAFPVHDSAGNVIGAHYRIKDDGNWRYTQGANAAPLVIGKSSAGDPVHAWESQWNAFAFMDKSGERSGIIITRGASNGRVVGELVPKGSTLYLWTQNDQAGEKWEKDICANAKCLIKRVKIPPKHKDLNDHTRAGATDKDLFNSVIKAETIQEAPRPLIEFKKPSELKNFIPPPGIILIGDCHIVRGSVFVIGGAPGVGKSRASVALAEAGATAQDWFGLTVQMKFKTMIVQTENGPFRLSKEFGGLDCEALEDYVRISPHHLAESALSVMSLESNFALR